MLPLAFVQLPKLHNRVAKGIPDCVRGTVWKLIVDARGVQKELGFSYAVSPPFIYYFRKY
jgi:hypothetical protein